MNNLIKLLVWILNYPYGISGKSNVKTLAKRNN